MEYFNNESLCDVVFLVEGQPLLAKKQILIFNNTVFRAMFSDGFKESNEREVVIEDTTYEAFKTLILFIYCNQLVSGEVYDFAHIEQVCKLADKYDAPRLLLYIFEDMKSIRITLENVESISRIAVNYKNDDLINNINSFISYKFKIILTKNDTELHQMNDFTDNQLFKVLLNNYRKVKDQLSKANSDNLIVTHKLKALKRGECSKCGIITMPDLRGIGPCKMCGSFLPD